MPESTISEQDIRIATERIEHVRQACAVAVIGQRRELDLLLCALLAKRHVLLEGVPGLGKTHLAQTLAATIDCTFTRLQFTPDLLPADILGGYVYNTGSGDFDLRKGPVFTNVLLADEINRAPAKTQAAMLEVMQERQVSIEGTTLPLDPPFIVMATQNPIDHEGVYPLPQAQLDRFAMRIIPAYPPPADEQRILRLHTDPLPVVSPVLTQESILDLQRCAEQVTVSDEITGAIVRLCNATRAHDAVELGASPRLGLDLMHLARARALMEGRGFVIPDDIKHFWNVAANHRIMLTTRAAISGTVIDEVLDEALHTTALV